MRSAIPKVAAAAGFSGKEGLRAAQAYMLFLCV